MSKKRQRPNIIERKLKGLSHEAMAIMDFLVAEAVVRSKAMHYRLSIPYRSIVRQDTHNDGDIVIEIKVYYRGEFKDEPTESPKDFKITGPDKGRH